MRKAKLLVNCAIQERKKKFLSDKLQHFWKINSSHKNLLWKLHTRLLKKRNQSKFQPLTRATSLKYVSETEFCERNRPKLNSTAPLYSLRANRTDQVHAIMKQERSLLSILFNKTDYIFINTIKILHNFHQHFGLNWYCPMDLTNNSVWNLKIMNSIVNRFLNLEKYKIYVEK